MRKLIVIFCLFLCSCSSTTKIFRIKTSDHLDIKKGEINQVSKVAEYKILPSKVSGSYSGEYKTANKSQAIVLAKNLALGNAVMDSKCDFLVNPQYDVKINGNSISVKVVGYPAIYTKFTTQVKNDSIVTKKIVVVPTSLDKPEEKEQTKKRKTIKNNRVKRIKKHPSNTFYLSYANVSPIGKFNQSINNINDTYVKKYGNANTGFNFSIGLKSFFPNKTMFNWNVGLEYGITYLNLKSSEENNTSMELRLGPVFNLKLTEKIHLDLSFLILTSIGRKSANVTINSNYLSVSNEKLFNFGSVMKADIRFNKFFIGTSLSIGREKMSSSLNNGSEHFYKAPTSRLSLHLGFTF